MNIYKIFSILIISIITCTTWPVLANTPANRPVNHIVAIVNDNVITDNELKKHTKLLLSKIDLATTNLPPKKILEQQILNKMILDTIQLQLATDSGIETDSLSINQTLNDLAKADKLSLSEFKNKIEKQGLAFTDYRNYLQTEITISKLQQRELIADIRLTNADIEGYLNSPVGQDQSGTQYNLGHILISIPESPTPENLQKIQDKANKIIDELKNGADFGNLAIAKSSGQQAFQGGNLGWRRIGELPTLFVKYLPSMQKNEIAGPIRSASGLHIIKLMGKKIGQEEIHTETHVRQILINPSINTSAQETENSLLEIRKKIQANNNFGKMAEQYSEELSTAVQGGDLGWVTEKSVLPKFYTEMSRLNKNELSLPFKSELGWHLIQVLDRRTQNDSLEAARNKATELLKARKFDELLEAWLKRIRDEAQVEILL